MLAGMILMSLLGAAAIAFSNVGVAPSSQIAQVIKATPIAPPTVDPVQRAKEEAGKQKTAAEIEADRQKNAQKCQIGYDYVIHEKEVVQQDGKKVKTWGTSVTRDGKTAVQAPDTGYKCAASAGGQSPGFIIEASGGQQLNRQCNEKWACKVYYCEPDYLLTVEEKKNGQSCFLAGECGANEDCKTQQIRNETLQPLLVNKLALPNSAPEYQRSIELARSLDPAYSTDLLRAIDERKSEIDLLAQTQQVAVDAVNKEAENLARLCAIAENCPDEKMSEWNATKQRLREEEQKLMDLRRESQALEGSKTVLAWKPGTPAPSLSDPGPAYQPPATPGTFPGTQEVEQLKEQCKRDVLAGNVNSAACLRSSGYPGADSGLGAVSRPGAQTNNPTWQNSLFGSGGFGNIGSWLGIARGVLGLANTFFNFNAPSCTLTTNPASITTPGTAVTLSWQTKNAVAAYLSNAGQVGPNGSMQIKPEQTTTYQMQVMGAPQQGQQNPYNPYGGYQQQDPYCVTSTNPVVVMQYPAAPGCYNYRQTTQQGGFGAVTMGQFGQPSGGQTAQCQVQVTVTPPTTATGGGGTAGEQPIGQEKPSAQISCQPLIADVGMQIAISYACQNAASSAGDGFSTNNALSGSATATVGKPALGATTATYGVTCSNQGQTDSKQCTVEINRIAMTLVTSPKKIKSGESVNVGWVTGGMESCVIASPTHAEFTTQNASTTKTSGTATSPKLTQNATFVLSCTTKAGGTKTATTEVVVE